MLENQPSLRLLLKHWLCVLRKGCRRSDEDALDPLHSGLATTTMTPRWSVVYVLRLFDSTRLLPSAASWFISFFSLLFDYLTTLLLYTCIALYLIPSLPSPSFPSLAHYCIPSVPCIRSTPHSPPYHTDLVVFFTMNHAANISHTKRFINTKRVTPELRRHTKKKKSTTNFNTSCIMCALAKSDSVRALHHLREGHHGVDDRLSCIHPNRQRIHQGPKVQHRQARQK